MAGLRGMSATTGRPLDGLDHLVQSIRDVLGSPLGSRVMLRDYGSRLPDLLDRPIGPGLTVEIVSAVAEALYRWEPRYRLRRVAVASAAAGHVTLDLLGIYRPEGREVTLTGIVL